MVQTLKRINKDDVLNIEMQPRRRRKQEIRRKKQLEEVTHNFSRLCDWTDITKNCEEPYNISNNCTNYTFDVLNLTENVFKLS